MDVEEVFRDDDNVMEEEDTDEITEVINSFFLERGLVSQQLDSFNTFMGRTIHEQITDQSNRGIEVESKAQVCLLGVL